MKNTQSKTKPVKTYCLGCKDYLDNFKSQEIKLKNKVLREKSNCVVCCSRKIKIFIAKTQKQKIISATT